MISFNECVGSRVHLWNDIPVLALAPYYTTCCYEQSSDFPQAKYHQRITTVGQTGSGHKPPGAIHCQLQLHCWLRGFSLHAGQCTLSCCLWSFVQGDFCSMLSMTEKDSNNILSLHVAHIKVCIPCMLSTTYVRP